MVFRLVALSVFSAVGYPQFWDATQAIPRLFIYRPFPVRAVEN
jgi:hypothetical protein